MVCEKCGIKFNERAGNSVVVMNFGVLVGQLCHLCHTTKHLMMDDPSLAIKTGVTAEIPCNYCPALNGVK